MDSFTIEMLVQAIKSNDEKAPRMLARITQNQIADTLLPWERCILVRSLGGRKCLVSGSIPATVVGEGTRLPLLCKLDTGATREYSFDGFSLAFGD